MSDTIQALDEPMLVICPRECPSPKTEHCYGLSVNGRARCLLCGRWMPMDEAIWFTEGS